jgi:hypothetical protein
MAGMANRTIILAALLAAAILQAGCSGFKPISFGNSGPVSPPPAAPITSARPQPVASTAVEFGVRTLRLQYSLPGLAAAPTMFSFEQIDIRDEANKRCEIYGTYWGKATDYWVSISFAAPAEARKINANFTLVLDDVSYPLTAVLTRIDEKHWRVDYNVTPPLP